MRREVGLIERMLFVLLFLALLGACQSNHHDAGDVAGGSKDAPSAESVDGYKENRWGDSLSKVEQRVGKLKNLMGGLGKYAPMSALASEYNDNLGLFVDGIPNPMSVINDSASVLWLTSGDGIEYGFVDSRLFSVSIPFQTESPISHLEDKYGHVKKISGYVGGKKWESMAWFVGDKKIVVYEYSPDDGLSVVTYLDQGLYRTAASRLVSEDRQKQSRSIGRLD